MNPIWAALLLSAALPAQWMEVKPSEFKPLTSLPWTSVDAPLETVLGTIFRESNLSIRYRVLAEYLRLIPKDTIGRAFELCVPLEATQNPDDLVEFFIPIWAERDPLRCWEQVKRWLRLLGPEHSVLTYDGWTKRPRIVSPDLKAIRASAYWIKSKSLTDFPAFLGHSKLAKEERVRILREFTQLWLRTFASWPGRERAQPETQYHDTATYQRDGGKFVTRMLTSPVTPEMIASFNNSEPGADAAYEIALRRMLQAEPATAAEVIKKSKRRWPVRADRGSRFAGPSIELLMVWAAADLPGMVRWIETLEEADMELALRAKGMVLSRVDAAIRKRWLNTNKGSEADKDVRTELFTTWAQWDFQAALRALVEAGDNESARGLANSAVYTPWMGQLWNGSRHPCAELEKLDLHELPKAMREAVFADCYSLMEQWVTMDVAGAARFGLNYLLQTDYAPREGLIQFFSGKDIYPGEDGMIDRTFCALRVWAVVRPAEMKARIGTLQDPGMQKALTWLLENPWGSGKDE